MKTHVKNFSNGIRVACENTDAYLIRDIHHFYVRLLRLPENDNSSKTQISSDRSCSSPAM